MPTTGNNGQNGETFRPIEHASIRLPKGGGAIRGVGEKFQANPVTGSGSFSIPVPAPPGRGKFQPELSLGYDSGSGNGPFGLGWSVGLPSITRKTDKELPRYLDLHEKGESDTYILAGAEDLVPACGAAGERISYAKDEVENSVTIHYTAYPYRPRIEGLFAKIEKWVRLDDPHDFHWRVTTKENITTLYGKSAACRISDPRNDGRIFQWLIERSFDARGNTIRYEYKAEDAGNILHPELERDRIGNGTACANRYVKRIKYSPFADRYHFLVLFDYGEHAGNTAEETAQWTGRPDPFSAYKAGFEVRTYRLCGRILIFHNFTDEPSDDWELTKSLDLTYNEGAAVTFLASAALKGYHRKGTPESPTFDTKSMPPVEFTYSVPEPQGVIKHVDPENLANLPEGLDDREYQWVDLKGEGSPGILSRHGGVLYYRENRGGAKFGRMTSLGTPSALSPDAAVQVTDVDGNGVSELVVRGGQVNGYYGYAGDRWDRFVSFKKNPAIDWGDPNLKLIDVTGDGFPDIVISEEKAFRYYPSKGAEGYDRSVGVSLPDDELKGPKLVFSDPTQSIYLADMSGDGMTDIVRIRNGQACYWPNLGYGRFGERVTMGNAPVFAPDSNKFNQHYIKLGDIDGSGTTDIMYLGDGSPKIYYNLAGNAWSEAMDALTPGPSPGGRGGYPPVDSLSSVSMIDLEGKGTMCLVWSTQRPGMRVAQMSYVDLMGVKPHLLTEINDNMGSRTKLSYVPSTKFYLEDRRSGRPWITRLPFPVHCLEKVETIDEISGSRLVTTYAYHGYFDGVEREFRGFGMVETVDAETFEEYALTPQPPLPEGEGVSTYVAPVLTKTWYHTGAYVEAGKISKQYEKEYFQGDADAFLLPDTVIEGTTPALSPQERREAYRALRGSALRQETYELGVAVPYEVKESNFIVKTLQRKGDNKHAVFFTHANESIAYHYEKIAGDPRVAHEFTLEVDDFGNVTKAANAVYPRRTVSGALPEQLAGHATLTVKEYINETGDFYLAGLPFMETVYDLGTDIPSDAYSQVTIENMRSFVETALTHVIPPEEEFTTGTPQARMTGRGRQYFWNEAQSAALPLGQTTARALAHHNETAALTPGLVQAAYGTAVTTAMLNEAGYVTQNGTYYNPGLTQHYSTGTFYLPIRTEDPFGGFIEVTYDGFHLFPIQTGDALGNTSTALMDYRTLTPKRLTDANGNVSEAYADAMGMVLATSVYGEDDSVLKGDMPLYDVDGDALTPLPPLPEGEGEAVEEILSDPLSYLQNATTYFYYDLNSWRREQKPPHFVELARETHVRDLEPEETTRVRMTIGFSDGFEREIQTKVKVEPGLAWAPTPQPPPPEGEGGITFTEQWTDNRWLVSGRTVYNNKQKPVKQYEPFYSGTPSYEDEEFFATYGVTSILHYDPLLRVIRTDTPKGFFFKVEFTPWEVKAYDENDTVTDSDYYATYVTLSTEEKEALDKAAVHYNTPAITRLDTLGREFLRATPLTPGGGTDLVTYTEFTITGKPKRIYDPRQYDLTPPPPAATPGGTANYSYTYDMTDRIIRTKHIDGADDRVLFNILTNAVISFDAKGHVFTITYDLLQRPTSKTVTGDGLDNTVERLIYGEGQATPETHNLRGRLYRHYDQAGRITNSLYSFKGEPITSERRVRTEYKLEANWQTGVDWDTLLDAETYTTTIHYDALGKITEQQNPDTSITMPEYHLSGNLNKVTAQLKGETTFSQFVTGITYNPKGQRENITYGNGTKTDYTYEDTTFRLTGLVTTRTSDSHILQNISYTYDPVGNITLVNDASVPCVFNNNQMVEPKQKYTYDALYRLIQAEGREHTALNNPDYYKDPNSFKQSAFIHLIDVNDDNKLANYTRNYTYDNAGNMLAIQHIAALSPRSFTREINVDTTSNRWLPANMGSNPDFDDYYDSNGNITELEHLQALTWNYRDNISSAVILERPGGPNDAEYYVYDSAGQRVRKLKETLRTVGVIEYDEKIYLGGMEIKKIRANSTPEVERTTLHVMDDRKRIATVHNWSLDSTNREINGPSDLNVNKARYQYGNHLDSASLELDTTGNIISYEEYFPYGDTSFIAGTNQKEVKLKEYRYTGKEKDDATGLYYYGARYYASWVGRWLSCDPLFRENPIVYEKPKPKDEEERKKKEQEFRKKLYTEGLNLYGYVTGNPVTMADPNGLLSLNSIQNYFQNRIIDVSYAVNSGVNQVQKAIQTAQSLFGGNQTPATRVGTATSSIRQRILNLTNAQTLTRNNPNYLMGAGGPANLPGPGKTWCHQATMDIIEATGAGLRNFIGGLNRGWINANQMVAAMLLNVVAGNLQMVSATRAQELANQGYTVVVGWINPTAGRSGHVATLIPGTDNLVSNVGIRNEISNLNGAFGTASPLFFFYNPNQTFVHDPSKINRSWGY